MKTYVEHQKSVGNAKFVFDINNNTRVVDCRPFTLHLHGDDEINAKVVTSLTQLGFQPSTGDQNLSGENSVISNPSAEQSQNVYYHLKPMSRAEIAASAIPSESITPTSYYVDLAPDSPNPVMQQIGTPQTPREKCIVQVEKSRKMLRDLSTSFQNPNPTGSDDTSFSKYFNDRAEDSKKLVVDLMSINDEEFETNSINLAMRIDRGIQAIKFAQSNTQLSAALVKAGLEFDSEIEKITKADRDYKTKAQTTRLALHKQTQQTLIRNIGPLLTINGQMLCVQYLKNIKDAKQDLIKRNQELHKSFKKIPKNSALKKLLPNRDCDICLMNYNNKLISTLTAQQGKLNRYLYLDSPAAKIDRSTESPIGNLWNLLLGNRSEANQDSDALQKLAIKNICDLKEPPLSKPWFWQIEKKMIYKEQQVKIALKKILGNSWMSYRDKADEIHRIFNHHYPRNYEFWFNRSATEKSVARLDTMIDKANLLSLVDSFATGNIDINRVTEVSEQLAKNSRDDKFKNDLNLFVSGINTLKQKYDIPPASSSDDLMRDRLQPPSTPPLSVDKGAVSSQVLPSNPHPSLPTLDLSFGKNGSGKEGTVTTPHKGIDHMQATEFVHRNISPVRH